MVWCKTDQVVCDSNCAEQIEVVDINSENVHPDNVYYQRVVEISQEPEAQKVKMSGEGQDEKGSRACGTCWGRQEKMRSCFGNNGKDSEKVALHLQEQGQSFGSGYDSGTNTSRSTFETRQDMENELQKHRITYLRKQRVEQDRDMCHLQVSKLQSGCWMSRDNEKHIEGWQDATLDCPSGNQLSPRAAKMNACKVRMREKMHVITEIAKNSPLCQVPAHEAVHFFASRLAKSEMDQQTFVESTKELVERFQKQVSDEHVIHIFQALDLDGAGFLDHIEWISSVPLFYGADIAVAIAVFNEIDQDKSGALDLDEFGDYASTTISMLVPPEDKELRKKMKKQLAVRIFAEIDVDGGGTITAEEFTQWSQVHSLGSAAIACLEEVIREEEDRKASKEAAKPSTEEKSSIETMGQNIQEMTQKLASTRVSFLGL